MANYNRIILAGNLTRDPQLSQMPSGVAVCETGLAVNRTWRDREGNKREETCFIDFTLFGRGAEVFNQYMAKGQPVLIEGRLKYDQWTTPEGQKRSKHKVYVDNFQFMGGGPGGGGGRTSEPSAASAGYSSGDGGAGSASSGGSGGSGGGYGGNSGSYGGSGYGGADAEAPPPPPTDADVPF